MERSEQLRRLDEYGMRIGKTRNKQAYQLRISPGRTIAEFPTFQEAYEAFEQILDRFWEFHGDDFYELARQTVLIEGVNTKC